MISYQERAAEAVWGLLRDGSQAFITDRSIGPVGAAKIAESIQCHCAYRHERTAYEFAIDALTPLHPLDLILIGKGWEAAK